MTLTYEEIIDFSVMNLSDKGLLTTIIPFEHYDQFKKYVEETKNLFINKILMVKGSLNSCIKRVLIEVSRKESLIE